jgi:ABC-type multidrug transport system fused ATPase/permease subunit
MMVTLLIGLVAVSPVPSLMFLGVLGIGGFLIVKIIKRFLDACSGSVYNAKYYLSKLTHLALHGLKEMRLYRRENALFSKYTCQLTDVSRANRTLQTFMRLPVSCLEILGFATLVAVMVFLIFVQNAGMARISGIMGFLAAAAWRALPVANRLVDSLSQLRSGLPFLQKTAELVRLEKQLAPELLPLTDFDPAPLPFFQNIVLENLTFTYPEASFSALAGVSLTRPKGAMVGIVGLSGAGKSTLVNLLTGLLPPLSGRISVDGVPITKGNAGAWLRHIGYVAQSPYILDAPLAENVALSRWGEAIDRDRVLECCRMAALDFLDELKNGIDTALGDRGTRLSGGQAQRVAIARALYGNPDLIIFDEATSALDMKNEKAIHDTILSLREHVTMVIIAHRLTTVEGCDTLVWVDKGRVVKTGSVESVISQYQALLRRVEAKG